MLAFLAEIGTSLAANAFKLVFGVVAAAALFGGGFVLGDNHATAIALKSAAAATDAQVAATRSQDQAVIASYLGQLKTQKTRGDALASSLAQSQTQLATATAAARKALADAMPDNPVCDLAPAAVAVLRAQPARQ